MTNEDITEARIAADEAKKALDNHLGPAFEYVEALYTARLKNVAAQEPWAADKLRNLALAVSVAGEMRAAIESVVAGGMIAQDDMRRMSKIEKMSPERRRILGV